MIILLDGLEKPLTDEEIATALGGYPTLEVTIRGAAGSGKSIMAQVIKNTTEKNLIGGRFKQAARIVIRTEQA